MWGKPLRAGPCCQADSLIIEETGTDENGVAQFRVYGGGYGHGVGMSQNGAQAMAKAGMGYEEILKYFYDGVTIEEKE